MKYNSSVDCAIFLKKYAVGHGAILSTSALFKLTCYLFYIHIFSPPIRDDKLYLSVKVFLQPSLLIQKTRFV